MARKQGLMGKTESLKRALERNKIYDQAAKSFEKKSTADKWGNYRGEKGRFLSNAEVAKNREYAVVLRAQVDQESFRIFKSALSIVGDEVADWAKGVNTSMDLVSKVLSSYTGIGLQALSGEIKAINLSNRLGLSLPQGRAWSRTLETMGITSMDELAEVFRNPLERKRLVALQSQNEEMAERRENTTIKKGVENFNDLNIALDLFKSNMKDFIQELTLANSGFAKSFSGIVKSFKPLVDPESNWNTIKNVGKSIVNTVSKSEEEIPGLAPLAGGIAIKTGVGGAKAVSRVTRALSPVLKGAASSVGGTEGKVVSKLVEKAVPGLGKATLGKFALGKFVPFLGNILTAYGIGEFLGSILFEGLHGDKDTNQIKKEKAIKLAKEQREKQDEEYFQDTGDLLGLLDPTLRPGHEEPQNKITDGKSPGDALPLFPTLFQMIKNFYTESFDQFTKDLKGSSQIRTSTETKEATQSVEPMAPASQVTFNIGDIIVQVPKDSDGTMIGRDIVKSVEKETRELGYLSSQQIASRNGRVW